MHIKNELMDVILRQVSSPDAELLRQERVSSVGDSRRSRVLVRSNDHIHNAIKFLGLSYLLYLAYRIATSAPDSLEGGRSRPLSFFEAALFQWINPKAWMMGISAIGTYTSVGMAMAPQVETSYSV